MYPILLLLFVFGKEFDLVGLMGRQSEAIRGGRIYSERIGGWNYTTRIAADRCHMDITL